MVSRGREGRVEGGKEGVEARKGEEVVGEVAQQKYSFLSGVQSMQFWKSISNDPF